MIISNTTPLINFSSIDRPDILYSLFKEIYVPKSVISELKNKRNKFPFIDSIQINGNFWINEDLYIKILNDSGE